MTQETDNNVCSTKPLSYIMIEKNELHITRRHLPHWTLKNSTYFLTFRVKEGELSIKEQKLVLDHIIDGDRKFYLLVAVTVMPDHVHLLLTPQSRYSLSQIMKGIKGVSARKINLEREKTGSIWQEESFDRIIRNQDELHEKIKYMMENPVKRGLIENLQDYHGWYFNSRSDISV